MRKGRKWGIELVLTENEHSSLIKRFDDKNAKLHPDIPRSHYQILKDCILCRKFFDEQQERCEGCPMEVFRNLRGYTLWSVPCSKFIFKLLGQEFVDKCFIKSKDIMWWKEDDRVARNGLRKIRKALLEMKRF